MSVQPEIKCKGYVITLTDTMTGKSVCVRLADAVGKWVVEGDRYSGYFKNLDNAYREACRHLKHKTKGMEDAR